VQCPIELVIVYELMGLPSHVLLQLGRRLKLLLQFILVTPGGRTKLFGQFSGFGPRELGGADDTPTLEFGAVCLFEFSCR